MNNTKFEKSDKKPRISFGIKIFVAIFFLSISGLLTYLDFTDQIETNGRGMGGSAAIGGIVFWTAVKEKRAHNQKIKRTDK